MSEPNGGGSQQPGPDQDQDQTSGSVFSDPTAPVWADPTAPVPTPQADDSPCAPVQDAPPVPFDRPIPPAPPGGAAYPYGQQPTAPQVSPPAAPPMSNPYAQQPPVQQYGQQAPAYGQQFPGYGQQPYGIGTPTESNVSAIIVTIVSALAMLSTCFIIGIPSLIFGIMALTANNTDPVGSRKKAKTGWIVLGVNVGIVVLVVVIATVVLAIGSSSIPRSGGSV